MRNRISTILKKSSTAQALDAQFNESLSREQKNQIRELKLNLQKSATIDLFPYIDHDSHRNNIIYLLKVKKLLTKTVYLDAWLKLLFEESFKFTTPAAESMREGFIKSILNQTDIADINPFYFLHGLITYRYFNSTLKTDIINLFYSRGKIAPIQRCENPINFILNAGFRSKENFHPEPTQHLIYEVMDSLIKRLKLYSIFDENYSLLLALLKIKNYSVHFSYCGWLNAESIIQIIHRMNSPPSAIVNTSSPQASPRKLFTFAMIKLTFGKDYAYQSNLCTIVEGERRLNPQSLFSLLPRDVTEFYICPMIMHGLSLNK